MAEEFTNRVIEIIKSIPRGRVLTYGIVAAMAGNPRGARQVSRILHSSSRKHGLPWYRVINSRGTISLPRGKGYEKQRELLLSEGIIFSDKDKIDLSIFMKGE
ncbi:MAG TPA: MGMT family protein [Spirochaetota bacterium]|nr:MGMT family protein [Spirochaetota bacterium]HRX48454.1 MGMT family protein [Spirochaetota bacterium]